MKKYDIRSFQTYDINRSLDDLGNFFLRDVNTELYVIDSEQTLYGIITVYDFINKIAGAKSALDIMNEEYTRCIYNPNTGGYLHLLESTKNTFDEKSHITQIAVVDENNKLLFSVKREFCNEDFLKTFYLLKEKEEKLSNFFELINVKSIGIVGYDLLLLAVGEMFEKYVKVNFYDRERYDIQKSEDLILFSDFASVESKQLSLEGIFAADIFFITAINDWLNESTYEKINKIKKAANEILYFRIPQSWEVKSASKLELERIDNPRVDTPEIINTWIWHNEYDKINYASQLMDTIKEYTDCNGNRYLKDYESEYVNIINGERITTDKLKNYSNKLYVLGSSLAVGVGNEDKNTIQSFMQRIFNDSNYDYEVVNSGGVGEFLDFVYNEFFSRIKKGDKIIIIDGDIWGRLHIRIFKKYLNFKCYDLTYLFDRPHNMGEVFLDLGHINRIGNKRVAEEVVKIMKEHPNSGVVKQNGADISEQNKNDNGINIEVKEGVKAYLRSINYLKVDFKNTGAIVMNCNPFTNGHRHLIEYAAKQSSHLYVFIVEEDKSYFKFKDRLAMVKAGTADLSNVTVLPGGKFIISNITFGEYFNKDNLQDIPIDPVMDIEIFSKYIAPELNITARFAGEEPNCYVTNQYNKAMREILPKYNIRFVEIPRKEHNAKPISASTVRNLLKEKDYNAIKAIVPQTTYDFLIGLTF